MRRPAATIGVVCATLVAFVLAAQAARSAQPPRPAQPPPSAKSPVGLHITGTNIVEANGNSFVMRGVSYPYAWHENQNQSAASVTKSFADIKALGANTLRVVLDRGDGAGEVRTVISMCKQNRLICVLENHDTTGYGDNGAAITLDQAADYWIGLKSVLAGQESYVAINIGNEPYGNNNAAAWPGATSGAIKKLRDAGLKHLIMADAPNWGQDWSGIMRSNAPSVFNSDPQRNTVFSVHMYGVYGTASQVTDYYNAFQSAGLPLVVGEFGWKHTDGDVDEDTIINEAQSRGIGYLGWSWSGNSGGVEYLDMVTNFNPDQLTSWGQRIFNGANGIRATSTEATVYGGRAGVG